MIKGTMMHVYDSSLHMDLQLKLLSLVWWSVATWQLSCIHQNEHGELSNGCITEL